MPGLLVVDGGDRFWQVFHAVPEGKMVDGRMVPLTAGPGTSSTSVLGLHPSDDFWSPYGSVAGEAALTLGGSGEWQCTDVSLGDAVIVEVGPFGQLVAHVEAYFDCAGPEDARERVTVRGNSREGLRAYPDRDGRAALESFLGR